MGSQSQPRKSEEPFEKIDEVELEDQEVMDEYEDYLTSKQGEP
jgi:hypothetical protein